MPRKARPRPPRSRDSAYKRLFSHKDLVADLIRGYVDPGLANRFDLESLERCNGSYISQDLRGRENDIVWRVKVKDEWVYVYLLLEFQSTVDHFMAVRLLGYIALLWQDLIAAKEISQDGTLPPVLPIVLYNGDRQWSAPTCLRELIASPIDLLAKYKPDLRYLFLDENRAPTADGLAVRNLVAAVFALEQTPGLEAQRRVIAALRDWLADRRDLKVVIGTWYAESLAPTGLPGRRRSARMSLDEIEPMMATRILADIERQKAESAAQGHAEGKAEGMIVAIRRLVESGVLSLSVARAQVKALLKDHQISGKLAKEALGKLA